MKQHIFIVRGVSNSGKTHTIRYIADQLVLLYMNRPKSSTYIASVNISVDIQKGTVKGNELQAVIAIALGKKRVLIGICTSGDSIKIAEERLRSLLEKRCDIIICGCKGTAANHDDNIYNAIISICEGYIPHSETTPHTKENPENPIKDTVASAILADVSELIDAELGIPTGVTKR